MKKTIIKSIQHYLIKYFSIAILIPTIILSIIGTKIIYNQVINRAETKTISDLNSAKEIYRNKVSSIEAITRLTALRGFIISSLIENKADTLQKELQQTLNTEKLDIFTIVNNKGIVICRGKNPLSKGDTLLNDKFVKRVLSTKEIVSGTDVMSAYELGRESQELVENAKMKIIQTPMSKARTDSVETSAMVLKSAVPVFDRNKNLVGVLISGVLLNRSYEIVNKIKEIVHEKEVYKGKEIGTATIFFKDLRISTNVKNLDGSFATGTLVSEEVYNQTLENSERWIGEAFVVNTWYISAYDPIKDIEGKNIGMLYVGLLKQPFNDLLASTILIFLGVAVIVLVIIYFVAIMLSNRITTPLRTLEEVAKKFANGDYKSEFTIGKAPREVENLAIALNRMAEEVESEKKELEEWADKMEVKVQERTAELKKIHGQLFRSEKLASIGKLAAGVAHEINNPLTGILTNASLLLEDLKDGDSQKDDVQVIVNETIRCREIVKRLLDFARQTKPQKSLTNINSLIDNIVLLVRNQTSFRNVNIERNLFDEIPEIMADKDQIQQVFINFVLNASDAMPNGGEIKISTRVIENGEYIEVRLNDTGLGISEENKHKIFDPFFTTKESGTGLGLSISYGIVEQHGGTINVESELGKGTTFIVLLPIKSIAE
ncbi:MAG: cache domain-containing protein [Ignavibacteriae bacterium]|nr:cache domain-containing protein [Ignavibacteriota bacterium]